MWRTAMRIKTIMIIGMNTSSLYWCMNLTMPSAVYAQVMDAIDPPTNVATSTRMNCIRDSNPSIAPTRTPEAMNGIQTNTIRPQNPHLLIISRFSLAMYSTVESVSPRNFVWSIRPPSPSWRAIATIRSSSADFRSTRPAPERSASVETSFRVLTTSSWVPSSSSFRSEMKVNNSSLIWVEVLSKRKNANLCVGL